MIDRDAPDYTLKSASLTAVRTVLSVGDQMRSQSPRRVDSAAAIEKDITMNSFHNFAWTLWLVGTVLIVGSWFHVVPIRVGWIGFAIAMAGSLISRSGRQYRPVPRRAPAPTILCETCRLNAIHACWRPERPNATECPDYERGS